MTHRADDPSLLDQQYQLASPRPPKNRALPDEDDPQKMLEWKNLQDHSTPSSTLDLLQLYRATRLGVSLPNWRTPGQAYLTGPISQLAQRRVILDVQEGGEELAVSKGVDLLLVRWIVRNPPGEAADDESALDAR